MPFQRVALTQYPQLLQLKFKDYINFTTGATAAGVDHKLVSQSVWNSFKDADVQNGVEADNIPGWRNAAQGYLKYHSGAMDLSIKFRRLIREAGGEVEQQSGALYCYIYFPDTGALANSDPPWNTDVGTTADKAKAIMQMKADPRCVWNKMSGIYDPDSAQGRQLFCVVKAHINLHKQLKDRRPETIPADINLEGTIDPGTSQANQPAFPMYFTVGMISEKFADAIPAIDVFSNRSTYVTLFKRDKDLTI